tara:strand:+ start:966 stop:1955 length:990 start_codon:yes stop_codon:yes gene_type:complete
VIINEARLKQIIVEEITNRLLEQIIEEELNAFLTEIDADWDAAKRRSLKSKIGKGLAGVTAATAIGGGLSTAVNQYGQAKKADIQQQQQINYEANSTIDNSVKQLEKQAGNFKAWMWKTNSAQTLPFPANPDNTGEAILPPEWSVLAQVTKDLKAQSPQYDVSKSYLQVANNPDSLASAYKNIKGKGDPGASTSFFDDFPPDSYPFSDASDMGAHGFKSGVPGIPSAMLDTDGDGAPDTQNLVYVPFDEIPDDYVMPLTGLTKAELYKKYYYGTGMSLEMFDNLKGDTESTPETEIEPELIQKTAQRAAGLKESRVTWRNYKNRKKKLA